MLSICIPIYNFDVNPLLESLVSQRDNIEGEYEIILIDDCSTEKFKKLNKISCEKFKYIELDKNIGRSKIRNLFLNYAKYENLLFLDCDSYLISNDFLKNYLEYCQENSYSVIFGGRVYPESCPSKNQILSWKYGINIESKIAIERMKTPNKSFMTNNFLIKKSILTAIKFDESLLKYGHEDTLFGFQLHLNSIEIKHIENPVLNGDIETNEVYLKKTQEGIKNLISILNSVAEKPKFIENVSVLKFYFTLKKRYLIFFVRIAFFLFNKAIEFLLKKGFVNLKLFSFYKLGYLTRIINKLLCQQL